MSWPVASQTVVQTEPYHTTCQAIAGINEGGGAHKHTKRIGKPHQHRPLILLIQLLYLNYGCPDCGRCAPLAPGEL